MKRIYSIIAALVLTTAAWAQTMNVVVGSVTYQFPAAQTGEMTYADGTSLTVMGKTFATSDISRIYIDETAVSDNSVLVTYDGASAAVTVSGNVARFVEPTVSGAHVTIVQSTTLDDTTGEIDYTLSGTSTDGEFAMSGSYKATINLNGLTLTNPSGAALNIVNGKRINISVKSGTTNTLTDGTSGSQKGCIYVKGHAEFKGKGTLNVYGNYAHGIKAGEYISVKNCTINVLKAAKDGINCNEYFLMESGTLNISGTGDDGIQADLDGTTSTGELTDHEGEDSGNVYIEDGTISVSVTAAATKGIKATGDLKIKGGTISVTTSGSGTYDSTEADAKGSAGLKSDGNMSISGGTITLKSTGTGGKCIKADGTLTISDGTIQATASGSNYTYSSRYTASAKAIKCDGALTISGGNTTAKASAHEAIESKSTILITGGVVYATSKDDAINSASTFTIEGGHVMGYSTGNDGLDANGNFYIKGGVVYAIGTSQPELGIDANTEGGYKLYVSGGTIIAIGGLESGASLTQSCYSTSSWSKNANYAMTIGSETVCFKTPSSGGTTLVVSGSQQPTLKSGVTVSGGTQYFDGMLTLGASASGGSSVSLSSYTGGNGGGGGPGGGGGGHRW
ncbi:MAG: carbohydrate-binding domain-containing protein [Prevotella sp.]|nr:carbohydrate-binding domain-containing protein [Prevotella sp.]MBR1755852.1 carbohydrate-binding domain-containing protein [Bacteroidaceae bacterium]